MKSETKDIKVSDVTVTSMNPREINKKALKTSDLYTSIENNGVQVPVMVRIVGKKYQLMAGERRLTIAKDLKLEAIPAIVYSEMTDEEAYDKMHFENADREALSPMEQAKDAQNLMKIYKGDIKAVAAKLGVPEHHARMRTKLNKLTQGWQEELSVNGDDNTSMLTVSHLALVAKCEDYVQDDLLDELYRLKGMSIAELETYINKNYTHLLDKAAFDKVDCEACEKRSDHFVQLGMWEADITESKCVRCLDSECFEKKEFEASVKIFTDLKEKHPNLVMISNEYGERRMLSEAGVPAKQSHEFESCKKAVKNSIPVVKFGKKTVSWVKAPKTEKSDAGRAIDTETGKPVPKTMKERREDLKGLRIKLVLEVLQSAIMDSEIPKGYKMKDLVALCITQGSDIKRSVGDDLQKTLKNLSDDKGCSVFVDWQASKEKFSIEQILWMSCQCDLSNLLRCQNGAGALKNEKVAKFLSELIGFDMKKAMEQAIIDKPEPKGWAGLNADGTKKGKK